MDIAAARKRCEAGAPVRGWTSSGNRYLTDEGHDYYRQLRVDCFAALEALEALEGSESARETLAELHESIASQLEAAGYVTPTPVAVEQLLEALEEAQAVIGAKCTIAGCWKSKYEEAQEALRAVRAWRRGREGSLPRLDRILSKEKSE